MTSKTLPPVLAPAALCSGCGACQNACPQNAIELIPDQEGFNSPTIDQNACLGCGLCVKSCPAINPVKLERFETPKTYACWSADEQTRLQSSSGGLFTVYAQTILDAKGVVFGAALNADNKVVLTRADSVEELDALRSSKYAQAEVGTIYREVKRELDAGRLALFSGVSCQIAGLYAYLKNDYPNLFTLDLVCHGAPSPTLFKKWIEAIENEKGKKIVALNLRSKANGWTSSTIEIRFQDAEEVERYAWNSQIGDYLSVFFLSNASLRASCGVCPYAKLPRQGDITLGDFWGIGREKTFDPKYEPEKGVSLNLIDSPQGQRLLQLAMQANPPRALWIERDLTEALNGNPQLSSPATLNRKRDRFVRDSVLFDYQTLRKKYAGALGPSLGERIKARIVRRFRKIVGKRLRAKLAAWFQRR